MRTHTLNSMYPISCDKNVADAIYRVNMLLHNRATCIFVRSIKYSLVHISIIKFDKKEDDIAKC